MFTNEPINVTEQIMKKKWGHQLGSDLGKNLQGSTKSLLVTLKLDLQE